MTNEPAPSEPTGTRLALIEAGFLLFGRQGYAATSTRELAAQAQTNIASIAYHFGSKEGLRLACAEEVIRRISSVAGSVPEIENPTPEQARAQLHGILQVMVEAVIVGSGRGDIIPFMLREITETGPAMTIVYERVFRSVHIRLCRLWAVVTADEADSAEVRLAVFTLIGQAIYFRIGRPIVLLRMDWPAIGPEQGQQIARRLHANLDAILDGTRRP